MERRANYLAALTEAFRRRQVTVLFIKENGTLTAGALSLATDLVSVIAANELWLQHVAYQDQLVRVLSVHKMRFSAHDTTLREFVIAAPDGLVVHAPFQSEGGMVTALARSQGPAPSGS